jgi:hypothetical protein
MVIIIILYFLFTVNTKQQLVKLSNSKQNEKQKSIEIVISRYAEDLKWTIEYPFNKYKYIVYNKGTNEEYEKQNVLRSYNIKNQGKCDHTYLYHVVHNYHNLSDIVVFLPGCINENYFKFSKTKILFELIEKYNEAFFIVDYHTYNTIFDEYYYFKVDDYKSMTKSNLDQNEEINFRTSKIRPFGKWYEQSFDYDIHNVSLFGIMSVNKKDVYNHSKQYYYDFMKSLEGAVNDELSHYFEKSWEAVFFPLNNTYLLYYTNTITNIISKIMVYTYKLYKNKFSLDLSASPTTGPILWNVIYFINNATYLKYNIQKSTL